MSRLSPSAFPLPATAPVARQRWWLVAGLMVLAALMLAGSVVINMAVAAEHDRVLQLKRQLVAHTTRIRELQAETELRARSALAQARNTEMLRLEPTRAVQYLHSPLQLAGFAATPQPGAATAGFQLALAGSGAQAASNAAPNAAPNAGPATPGPAAPGLPRLVRASWAPAAAAPGAPTPVAADNPPVEPR